MSRKIAAVLAIAIALFMVPVLSFTDIGHLNSDDRYSNDFIIGAPGDPGYYTDDNNPTHPVNPGDEYLSIADLLTNEIGYSGEIYCIGPLTISENSTANDLVITENGATITGTAYADVIVEDGSLTISSNATMANLTMESGCSLYIDPGITLTVTNTLTLDGTQTVDLDTGASLSVGTLTKSGTGTTTLYGDANSITAGTTVNVSAGTLQLSTTMTVPSITASGNVTISNNSTLTAAAMSSAGNITIDTGSTLHITSTLTLNNALAQSQVLTVNGTLTVPTISKATTGDTTFIGTPDTPIVIPTMNLDAGTVAIGTAVGVGSLNLTSVTVNVNASLTVALLTKTGTGTATFGGTSAVVPTAVDLAGGTLALTSAVTMNTTPGTFTVSAASTLSIASTATLMTNSADGIFIDGVTLTVTGGGTFRSYIDGATGALALNGVTFVPRNNGSSDSCVSSLSTSTAAVTIDCTERLEVINTLAIASALTLTGTGTPQLEMTSASAAVSLGAAFNIGNAIFTIPSTGSLSVAAAGTGAITSGSPATYALTAINVGTNGNLYVGANVTLATASGGTFSHAGNLFLENTTYGNGNVDTSGGYFAIDGTITTVNSPTASNFVTDATNGITFGASSNTVAFVGSTAAHAVNAFINSNTTDGVIELRGTITLNAAAGSAVGTLRTNYSYVTNATFLGSLDVGNLTVDGRTTNITTLTVGPAAVMNVTATTVADGNLVLNNGAADFTTPMIVTTGTGIGTISSSVPRVLTVNTVNIMYGSMQASGEPLGSLKISSNVTIVTATSFSLGGHLILDGNGVVDASAGSFTVSTGAYTQSSVPATSGQYATTGARAMISGASPTNLLTNALSGVEFSSVNSVLTLNGGNLEAFINGITSTRVGTIELRGNATLTAVNSSALAVSRAGTLMTTYGVLTNGIVEGTLSTDYTVVHTGNSITIDAGAILGVTTMTTVNGLLEIEGGFMPAADSKILTQSGGNGEIRNITSAMTDYTVREVEVMYNGSLAIGTDVNIILDSDQTGGALILLNGKLELATDGYMEFIGAGVREIAVSNPLTLSGTSALITSSDGTRTLEPTLMTVPEGCRLTVDADVELMFLADGEILLDGTLIVSNAGKVDLSELGSGITVNSTTAQVLRLETTPGLYTVIPAHYLTIESASTSVIGDLNKLYIGDMVSIVLDPTDGVLTLNGTIELGGSGSTAGHIESPVMVIEDGEIGVLQGSGVYTVTETYVGDASLPAGTGGTLYIWSGVTFQTYLTDDPDNDGTVYLGGNLALVDDPVLGESTINNLTADSSLFGAVPLSMTLSGTLNIVDYLNVEILTTLVLSPDADILVGTTAKVNGTLNISPGAALDMSAALLLTNDNALVSGTVVPAVITGTATFDVMDIQIINTDGHIPSTGLTVASGITIIVSDSIEFNGYRDAFDVRLPAVLNVLGNVNVSSSGSMTADVAGTFSGTGTLLTPDSGVVINGDSTFTIESDAMLSSYIDGQSGGTTGSTLVLNGTLDAKMNSGADSYATHLMVQESKNGRLGGVLRVFDANIDKGILTMLPLSTPPAGELYISDMLLLNGEVQLGDGSKLDVYADMGSNRGLITVTDTSVIAKITRTGPVMNTVNAYDVIIPADCTLEIGSTTNGSVTLDVVHSVLIDGTLTVYGTMNVAVTITMLTANSTTGLIQGKGAGKVTAMLVDIPDASVLTVTGFSGLSATPTAMQFTTTTLRLGTLVISGDMYVIGDLLVDDGLGIIEGSGTVSVNGLDVAATNTLRVMPGVTLIIRSSTTLGGLMEIYGELDIPGFAIGTTSLETTGTASIIFYTDSMFKVGSEYFLGPANCGCPTPPHYNRVSTGMMEVTISSAGLFYGEVSKGSSTLGVLELYDNPFYSCNFADGSMMIELDDKSTIYFGPMELIENEGHVFRTSGTEFTAGVHTYGSYFNIDRTAVLPDKDGIHTFYLLYTDDPMMVVIYYLIDYHDTTQDTTYADVTGPTPNRFVLEFDKAVDKITFAVSYVNYYYWEKLGDEPADFLRFPNIESAYAVWNDPTLLTPAAYAKFLLASSQFGDLIVVGNIDDNILGTVAFYNKYGEDVNMLFDPSDTLVNTLVWNGGIVTIQSIDITGNSMTLKNVDLTVDNGFYGGIELGSGNESWLYIDTGITAITAGSFDVVNMYVSAVASVTGASPFNAAVSYLEISMGSLTVDGDLTADDVNGTLGDLYVSGLLTVTDSTYVNGTLYAGTVDAGGIVTVTGNVEIGTRDASDKLDVPGAFYAAGDVTVGGYFTAGDTTVGDDLVPMVSTFTADGDVTVYDLTVLGNVYVGGILDADDVRIGLIFETSPGNFDVYDSSLEVISYALVGDLAVIGNVDIGKFLEADDVTIGLIFETSPGVFDTYDSYLNVTMFASVGDLTVMGNVDIGGFLEAGDVVIGSDDHDSYLSVMNYAETDDLTVFGNVYIDSYLKAGDVVIGSDVFDSYLNVMNYAETGDVTVAGYVHIEGYLTAGDVTVGNGFFDSYLEVVKFAEVGNLVVTDHVNVGVDLTASGYVDVAGAVTVAKSMSVSGANGASGNDVAISAGVLDVGGELSILFGDTAYIMLNEAGTDATTGRVLSTVGSFYSSDECIIELAQWHDLNVVNDMASDGDLTIGTAGAPDEVFLTVGGSVSIDGNFTTAYVNAEIEGNLEATGNADIGGYLVVEKDVILDGDLTAGDTEVGGTLYADDVTISGDLNVTRNVDITGNLTVLLGDAYVGDNLYAQDVYIAGNLDVMKNAETGDLVAAGDVTIGGGLDASGFVDVSGKVTVAKDMSVSGAQTVSGEDIAISAGVLDVGGELSILFGDPVFIKLNEAGTDATTGRVLSTVGSFYSSDECIIELAQWHDLNVVKGLVSDGDVTVSAPDVALLTVGGTVSVDGSFITELVDAEISGSLEVTDDVDVDGYLTVTGNAEVGNNVTVSGETWIGGNLLAHDVNIGDPAAVPTPIVSDLTVVGVVAVNELNVTGDVVVGDAAACPFDGSRLLADVTDIGGSLTVHGDTKITGTMGVGDFIDIHGNLEVKEVVNASSTVNVNGIAMIGEEVGSNFVPGEFTATGNVTIGFALIAGDVTIGNATTPSTLTVLYGNVTVDSLTVFGETKIGDSLASAGNVTIGDTSFVSDLSVNGVTTVGGALAVTGNVNVGESHADDGLVYMHAASVNVGGDLNVHGTTEVAGAMVVAGTATICGDLSAASVDVTTLYVDGIVIVEGLLKVTNGVEIGSHPDDEGYLQAGQTDIGGPLYVFGKVTVFGELKAGGIVEIHADLNAGSLNLTGTYPLNVFGGVKIGTYTDVWGGDEFVPNDLYSLGPVIIGGNLDAANAAAGSYFTVGGNVTLTGDLEAAGEVTIGGNLDAASVDAKSLFTVDGNVTLSGELAAVGTVVIGGNLDAANVDAGGVVNVTGNVTLTLGLEADGAVIIGGNLDASAVGTGSFITVSGNVTLSGDLDADGDVTVYSDLKAANVDAGGTFTVDGNVTLSGELASAGTILVGGNLNASNVDADGAVLVSGNVTLTLALEADGAVVIDGNLNASAADTGSFITVYGNVTLSGDLGATGEVTVFGSLSADNVDAGSTVYVTGNVTLSGALSAAGTITVGVHTGPMADKFSLRASSVNAGANLYVHGDANIDSAMTVAGDAYICGSLTAGSANLGSLTVGGNVVIDGILTVASDVMIGECPADDSYLRAGSADISGSLSVYGFANVIGELKAAGAVDIHRNLDAGSVDAGSTVNVYGSVTTGTWNAAHVFTYGTFTASGDVTIGMDLRASDVTVDGDVSIGKLIFISGTAAITGKLLVYDSSSDTTYIEFKTPSTVGSLEIYNSVVTLYGNTLTVTDGVLVHERLEVAAGGNINVTGGDVVVEDGAELLMQGNNLTVTNGNVNAGVDSIVHIVKGDMRVRGDVNADDGATVWTGEGNMRVRGDINAGIGSLIRADSGNLYVRGNINGFVDKTQGAYVMLNNGNLYVRGNVNVYKLSIGPFSFEDAAIICDGRIGGNLLIGQGGLYVSGNLNMTNTNSVIELYGDGYVKDTLNVVSSEIFVYDDMILTCLKVFAEKDLDLTGHMIVLGDMFVTETFTMHDSWIDLRGDGGVAADVVIEGSAILDGTLTSSGTLTVIGNTGDLVLRGSLFVEGDAAVWYGGLIFVYSEGLLQIDGAMDIFGEVDVLAGGELIMTSGALNVFLYDADEEYVNGTLNVYGYLETQDMNVMGTVNVTGAAVSYGIVEVYDGGILRVGWPSPIIPKTLAQGAFTMVSGELIVDGGGEILVYGMLDASAIPANDVHNDGYIWAHDIDDVHRSLGEPYGTAYVNYNVIVNGIASYTMSANNPVHVDSFTVKANLGYGYGIKGVTVSMHGVELVEGVHYIVDRNSVTILTDTIDGYTGDIVIDISSGFMPTLSDILIALAIIVLAIFLFFFLLFVRERRSKQ